MKYNAITVKQLNKYLKDRFNDDLLVTAAYNGGEGSVNKWVKKYSTKDYDEFIENIPFDETRNYVKKVKKLEENVRIAENIVNESERISMINSSRDMIPDDILLPKHPFVEDVSEVEAAIEAQRAAEEEEMEKQMKMYGNEGFNKNMPSTSTLPKVTSNTKKAPNTTKKDEKKELKAKSNTNS